MHELSVAQSLIDLASETIVNEGAGHVRKLNLRIGAMAGVVSEALRFSFELAAEGTCCEGAELEIEHVLVVVYCEYCEQEKSLECYACFVCPDCGKPTPTILSGRELELVSLEVDEHCAERDDETI